MLTNQDIERIKNLPEDKMVLMAVVNDNPAVVDNEGSGLMVRAKSMMSNAGVPPTIMNRVLDDLQESRQSFGKSALYVVAEDMFERYDVQVDLPERYHYGRPLKSMLDGILELMPSVGVLCVDREWARFFVLEQGELTEIRRRENVRLTDTDNWDHYTAATRHVPGVQGSGGGGRGQPGSGPRSDSGVDFFESREDAIAERFYKEMAEQLVKLMNRRGLKHLILVGPVHRLAEFKGQFPEKAPIEIIGETNVSAGAGWADPEHILEKITPMVEELREREERNLLDRIQEQGVMEVERVLEMIQQNQIYLLVIPEDGSDMHIYRSHNRDTPYFTSKDIAHSPIDDALMERVALDEALPDFVALYGVQVRRVHGDHAQKLVKEMGGLAGLTRF